MKRAPGEPRRGLVLAICCLSLFMVGLDNTIVNVALPAIGAELGRDVAGLQWTVAAYTLTIASLLMLGGSTADRLGRRRVLQVGLATFGVASLLCSLAPGLGWLIAARVLQGIGGAMLNPVAMSIITSVYPNARERARAIGVWGAVAGISLALGPVIGGLLVDSVGWRAVFWANVPVAVAAIGLTAVFVPESRAPRPRRPDPVGQALVVVLLASLAWSIIELPQRGAGSPLVFGGFGLALAALAGVLGYEPRRHDPLIDLRFFRSAPFAGATVIAVAGFGALSGFLFLNTLYLQEVRGLSPFEAGLWTLPMPGIAAVASPISGRLVGARGTRLPLALGGVCLTAGAVLLTGADATTPFGLLVLAYLVFGVGFGMMNPPITNTAVSGMPRAQAGLAAAVASTSRQVGQSLGVAVIGATVAAGLSGTVGPGFVDAAHGAWWIVAGGGAVVLVVGLLTSGARARGTAERTAERLGVEDAEGAPRGPVRAPVLPG